MKPIIGTALVIGQYACNGLAVLLTMYLLYHWKLANEVDPGSDPFNPWLPGIILFVLGVVFKLARKGLSAERGKSEKQNGSSDNA